MFRCLYIILREFVIMYADVTKLKWKHNTQHERKLSMPPVGFKPTISAGEWPQAYALNSAATGTGF
jgi:hypothetical protein